jgi:hypothetical protein
MPLPQGYEWNNQDWSYEDFSEPTKEEIDVDNAYDPTENWDWQNPEQTGPQGDALPNGALGWRPDGEADYGTGLSGWWNKASNKVVDSFNRGYEEGLKISGITEWAVKKVQGQEQGTETLAKMEEERKPETETGALFTASLEAGKEVFNQALWGVLDGLSMPAKWTEQGLGALVLAGQQSEKGEDVNWKRNFDSSQLAYSALFDATVMSEMNRRLDAGVRPDLAAMEIQGEKKWTLWPELVGNIVIDPLNLISIWGKVGQVAKMEKSAARALHEVTSPGILKMLDEIGDISKLDDAAAYARIEEVVKTQQGLETVMSHADDIATAGKDFDALSMSYKMSSLTRDGKIAHLAGQSSEILLHIANNAGPEQALVFVEAMAKSASKDTRIAAEGVATMLHFADAPALFSEAGNKTTVMLAKMMEKHGDDWLKNIEKLKGDPKALITDLLGKLDEVGQEMFPSVSDMMKAEKTVKAGQFASDAEKVKMTALAERAQHIPEYVKQATALHEKLQIVVGPINKFFIGTYMGWSPGYAFRNFTNNTMQILIDQGPRAALLGSADDMFRRTELLHGGVMADVKGFGQEAAAINKAGVTGGTGVKDIVGAAVERGLKGPVLGMAEKWEENAAKRIISHSYKQTFERGVKAMVRDFTPQLQEAGFSDDIIKRLPTYIMQNNGDAKAVINAMRTEVKSGVIDLFNDISRIDPKYKSFLESGSVAKWDEYVETVLKAPTREEALTNAKKIFDDLAQRADGVFSEGVPAKSIEDVAVGMEEKLGLSSTKTEIFTTRRDLNRSVIKSAQEILYEADSLGSKMGIDVGALKKAHGINEIDGWGREATKEADRLLKLSWKLSKDVDADKIVNFRETILAHPDLFQFEPPDILNKQIFKDLLWNHAKPDSVSNVWAKGRDVAIDGTKAYLDDLKKAGAQIDDKWYQVLKEAQDGAKQWDGAMMGKGRTFITDTPLPYGVRTEKITSMAEKYGVETKAKQHTLNIINKYAGVEYKSLEDVPMSVADEAFKKKAPDLSTVEGASEYILSSGQLKTETLKARTYELAKNFTKTTRGGLPKDVSMNVLEKVQDMKASEWYLEKAADAAALEPNEAREAIEKIIINHGADVGEDVEKLKRYIFDTFAKGDAEQKIPPDLAILEELKAPKTIKEEALRIYNEMLGINADLEDAIKASHLGVTPEELSRMSSQELGELYEKFGIRKAAFQEAESAEMFKRVKAGEASRKMEIEAGLAKLEGKTPVAERLLPPVDQTGGALTDARMLYEQSEGIAEIKKWMLKDIADNFGKKQVVDPIAEKALKIAEKQLTSRIAETRLISNRVAQESRNFTLLNYGEKSYWDTTLAYLYPFHFWYKGTYRNWLSRVASNPSVLANYSKYRQNLAAVHADLPEWWRYNINTNDLPGVDVENPMYFNLEATLWPLNGLTNVDFNDKNKITNYWTKTLDFANKFGPSTWTPISMITGLAMYKQGQQDAGLRWMGRLFPQSSAIKAVGSELGIPNLETDPITNLLAGGLDPYEQRRVERALAQMEQQAANGELPYTPEQIQDAGYSQDKNNPIWQEAIKRAVNERAPSQIASFLFGVGFKGRTQEDMQIDKFYTDYSKLWGMKQNLSPEEFKMGMDQLHQKYTFMDTVLLSRKSGVERDSGFAYTVMTRIPPGKSSEYAKSVGIDSKLMDKFYSTKGQLDTWSAGDRQRFMAGIVDLAAVLEIPNDMTRTEWMEAKNDYSRMNTEAEALFGEDILDLVDGFYVAKTKSKEASNAYLENYPQVEQYMNWKSERIIGSPRLSAYYGGASMIENYQRSQMYSEIETKLGKDIFDIIQNYNDLKTYGTSQEAKQYYNQNKKSIGQYYDIKDEWEYTINQMVAKLAAKLPDIDAEIRPDIDVTSLGAMNLAQSIEGEQQPTIEDFQAMIPDRIMNLVSDYYSEGTPLPDSANKQLERIAYDMGYGDAQELLQAIGIAMYR